METLAAFCFGAMALHLASIALAAAKARRRPAASRLSAARPPVTILRPVCGIENNVVATLASSFASDHPEDEVIFCVASPDDPVLPLLRRLVDSHPHRRARILVGDDRISINPKLNNVVKGWKAARHDWIAMVDSNVLMPPDVVARCQERWDTRTGLVCSPPIGTAPENLWAELECAWLNGFQARWQLAADALGIGFAQGKAMFWSRPILERAGGIERLAAEVAEDAAATKIVRGAGLSVRLVDRPFPQPLGRRSLGEVWRRQVRWARLRRVSFPLLFLPELLAGGALPITGAAVLAAIGTWEPASAVAFALVWYGAEVALARLSGWPASLRGLLAMVLRDLALPALWVAALLGDGFTWRGNAMTVAADQPRRGGPHRRMAARIRQFAAGLR